LEFTLSSLLITILFHTTLRISNLSKSWLFCSRFSFLNHIFSWNSAWMIFKLSEWSEFRYFLWYSMGISLDVFIFDFLL
jgi:hypothetical protein